MLSKLENILYYKNEFVFVTFPYFSVLKFSLCTFFSNFINFQIYIIHGKTSINKMYISIRNTQTDIC